MSENPDMSPAEGKSEEKPRSSWINLFVDFGPLLVFFATYKYYLPKGDEGLGTVFAVTKGTLAFMIAAVVALIISKWRLGKISPMVWLSTVLIIGFGGLTVLLNDPFYIQVKPTAIYLLFAVVLFAGLVKDKPMLRYLLESAFEGLDHEGWMKLSRNWAIFFVFLAVLNEAARHFLSFGSWLQFKLWGFTALSFLFTFSQLPMVLRHGLNVDRKDEVVTQPPHD